MLEMKTKQYLAMNGKALTECSLFELEDAVTEAVKDAEYEAALVILIDCVEKLYAAKKEKKDETHR
jgi:hypothetical protein